MGPLEGNKIIPKPELFGNLTARFPDVPNPRVWPFQVATGLGEAKS